MVDERRASIPRETILASVALAESCCAPRRRTYATYLYGPWRKRGTEALERRGKGARSRNGGGRRKRKKSKVICFHRPLPPPSSSSTPSLSFSFSLASVSPEPLAQRLGAFKAKLARGKPGRFESPEIAPAVERGGAGPRKRGRKEKGKGRGRGRQYE